jgi:hypothetical protein
VLCATEGATDLLVLRRQDRASLDDLARHHPPSLHPEAVPSRRRRADRSAGYRAKVQIFRHAADTLIV